MTRAEWLKWRHQGIGSSDAPVIMGASPWKTRLQLYEEKIQSEPAPEDGKNAFIKNRGNEIEAQIRAQFELLQGKPFPPCMIQDPNFEFLKATLDGRDDVTKAEFVEIKLLGKEDFATAKVNAIPEKYYWQVMHDFLFGFQKGWFCAYEYDKDNKFVYDPTRIHYFEVPYNEKDCDLLLDKEVEFWNHVVSKKPPEVSVRDFKRLTGAAKLAAKWEKLDERVKKLSKERDEIRKSILGLAELNGHPRLHAGNLHLQKISFQGRINYSKYFEEKKIDEAELEKYREPESFRWRMDAIEKGTLQ